MQASSPRASVLIPTWNSPTTLPFAVKSAINQSEEDIEIIIVGDGISPSYRVQISRLKALDSRIVFLDLPKGEHRGERNRHLGVMAARSDAIVYLADDDILMPQHVERMLNLLQDAPFVMCQNGFIDRNNTLQLYPTDLSQSRWLEWHLQDPPRNRVSFTGTAHTRDLYLQLDEGWKVTTDSEWADHVLWKQFFRMPGFAGITDTDMTVLQMPAHQRLTNNFFLKRKYSQWLRFSLAPHSHLRLQNMVRERAHTLIREMDSTVADPPFQQEALNNIVDTHKHSQ